MTATLATLGSVARLWNGDLLSIGNIHDVLVRRVHRDRPPVDCNLHDLIFLQNAHANWRRYAVPFSVMFASVC